MDYKSEECNGWSNWHTWNANLWLTNEYGTYQALNQCKDPQDVMELYLISFKPGLDGIDIKKVNWSEIYESTQEV